jgi:arsenite/tail-anchored protein-transporting ATPase
MAPSYGNGEISARPPPMLLMSSLDVSLLLDRCFLFIGGKGGVGKTTVASALGLLAAHKGRRCLLISTDPAHSLGDAFGRPIGSRVVPLSAHLDGLEIDPDVEAANYIATVASRMKNFAARELHDEIDRHMELARYSPGASEAALLERIARLVTVDADAYDLIIFDTAPTGHTLRLLALPELMASWTDGLLASNQRSQQFGKVLGHLSSRRKAACVTGSSDDPDGHRLEGLGDRTRHIGDALLERQRLFHRCRRLLTDPQTTAFVFVVTPERLPVLETARAVAALRRFDVPVGGMIVNRLTPALDGPMFSSRAAREKECLRMLDLAVPDIPRMTLPMLATDVQGVDALTEFATLIELRATRHGD